MAEGEGERKVAKKDDWKALPMPNSQAKLELNVDFSGDEMATIRQGVIPKEMEDKWFMYYEANENENRLYMHRSWTGFCVYVVDFEKAPTRDDQKAYRATSCVVNRDESQYNGISDEYDRETVLELINMIDSLGAPRSYDYY